MIARQPLAVRTTGMIKVADGTLYIWGWSFDLPGVTPARRLEGWSVFAGWSIRELHEMSHGAACRCPVVGWGHCIDGVTIRYDQRPPYVVDLAECTVMEGQS